MNHSITSDDHSALSATVSPINKPAISTVYISEYLKMSENENVRHGEPPVCKHYQRGYCRYGSKCLQPHISKICKDRICRKHNCRERHRRTCKFYASNGECKWKDTCAYDILEKEVKYLKEELQNLNNNMSEMMVKMIYLEENENHTISADKGHLTKEVEKNAKILIQLIPIFFSQC